MPIKPKVRGFLCTTAHPSGCKANVEQAIKTVQAAGTIDNGPKRVLVIGASTGYGLASRIMAEFGCHAETIGLFFEKPAKGVRTATPGWYNTVAFEQAAKEQGLKAWSINGDAFSNEIKQKTTDLINRVWPEGVDLIIYSLAAPRRTDPDTQEVYQSCLKTLARPYENKSINIHTQELLQANIGVATPEECQATVAVMGGDDWRLWINHLLAKKCIGQHATTLAYSYVGPELTHPMYRSGTIGAAKKHLEQTAKELNNLLRDQVGGHAYVSVNKAVVTQAAAAIPVVPLYSSILYKTMLAKGLHEGCIEQMQRLFMQKLYGDAGVCIDDQQRIRMDDYEMQADVQQEVSQRFADVNANNLHEYADIDLYRKEFMRLFGFEVDGIDYEQEVEKQLEIPSIASVETFQE